LTDKKNAPCSGKADTARDVSFADATNTRNIPPKRSKRHSDGMLYCIPPSAGKAFRIIVSGRDHWALDRLRKAGARGCTPIQNPAPRWAACVHNLRDLGLEIGAITEAQAHALAVLIWGAC